MLVEEFIRKLGKEDYKINHVFDNQLYNKLKRKEVKIGIYARISKGEERDTSVERQKSQMIKFLRKLGISYGIEEYEDEGISGSNPDRPAYVRMLNDLKIGKINIIFAVNLNRFGRDSLELINKLYMTFYETPVLFITYNNKMINTQENYLDFLIESVSAERYIQQTSEATREALKDRMEEGSYIGTGIYGYRINEIENTDELSAYRSKKVLEKEDNSSVEVIREIFNLYLSGNGYNSIAKKLTDASIKTPDKKNIWNGSTIKNILQNPLYGGILAQGRYKKMGYKKNPVDRKIIKVDEKDWIVSGEFDGIVSKEIYYEVQNQISLRSNYRVKGKAHIFTGILRCGDCGRTLVYKNGGYKCSASQDGSGCDTHFVKEDELINLIKKEFSKFRFDENLLKERLKSFYKDLYNLNNIEKEIDFCKKKINKDEGCIADIYIKYNDGHISEIQYKAISKRFEENILELELKIKQLAERRSLVTRIESVTEMLITKVKKFEILDNSILRMLIREIKVYNSDFIVVTWNLKSAA